MKTILLVIVVLFVVAYCTDPKALTPWKSVAENAGTLITHGVETTGKALDKAAKGN